MNDQPDEIDRLTQRIDALERSVHMLEPRVEALEHPQAARSPQPFSDLKTAAPTSYAAAAPVAQAPSLFPMLGRALLGIAGAYVLRAVEEANSLPRLAVAAAGILYAFLWLAWAARTRRGPRLANATYACTSALILAPMLWELTLRFKVLSPAIAAAVVCAFALVALGLARRRDSATVLRVAWIAAGCLTLALAVASRAMMPFIFSLLILTAACEFAPQFRRLPEIRALMALAADAAIWILIVIYFNPQNAREEYQALGKTLLHAPGVAILLLFASSVTWQTVVRARSISAFETIQTMIAFLLAAVSVADFAPARSAVILGVSCLVLSATSYAAVFTVFWRAPAKRNVHVFAAWGATLFLAGSFLCLPPLFVIVLLGTGAVAAITVGRKTGRLEFEFYGMVFLATAASASGLLSFMVGSLAGSPSGTPVSGVWLIAVCAVLCYLLAWRRERESWWPQALRIGLAALAAGALAALFAHALVALFALRLIPGAHHVAFSRTLALCVAALALAFAGARWRRVELTRLSYAALVLVAIKLIAEDLRHGHLAYIAASIFLVALTLIAAPRVARARLMV